MRIFTAVVYHKYQLEVLQQLSVDFGVDICGATIFPLNDFKSKEPISEKELQSVFSNTELIEVNQVYYPSKIKELTTPQVLPQKVLIDLKYLESLFYRATDRANIFPISVARRRRLYLKLVHFWYEKLSKLQPDYMLYFDTPHSFNGIIISELATYLGIPSITLEHTALQDYSLVVRNWEMPKVPDTYLEQKSVNNLIDQLPEDLQALLFGKGGEDHAFLKWYKERDAKLSVSKGGKASLQLYQRFLKKTFTSIARSFLASIGQYKKRILIEDVLLNDLSSEAKYRIRIIPALYRQIKLNRYYNQICQSEADLTKNYIFFGMHMQPEKTTLPLGEEYDNQLLAIETIAAALPEEWLLYVKEHPSQFNIHRPTNSLFRTKHFYDQLKANPKVRLLALNLDAKQLMQHAQFTATITGTVGWESLLMGVPCLFFGKTYYSACAAAFKIDSVESCRDAIKVASGLEREEVVRKALQFLHFYLEQAHFIKAVNWEVKFQYAKAARTEQIATLAKAFKSKME